MGNSSRDYTIPDADLMMFVSNLVQTMTRDAVPLADYSVDAADITALQTLGNQFEVFPPDIFYQADVGVAATDKDNKRIELIQATRKITNRALAKWGLNSSQYNKFGVKGISDMSDKEVLATSRLVVLTATGYLSQLSTEGLTQDIIDDYVVVSQQFEACLNAFNSAIDVRDVKTKERIALGNQLYALVVRYCTFGKTIWENVNEAKFNDYLVYTGSSPGSLGAPTGIHFTLQNMTLRWNTVENASSYVASISTDGGTTYQEVYTGSDTFFGYEPTVDGTVSLRVFAHNAGGNGPASIFTFSYFATLPAVSDLSIALISGSATMFQLTWSAIPSASIYKVYRSVVALGEPASDYSYLVDQAGTLYSGNAVSGMRTWLIIKSANDVQLSDWSNAVYLDVVTAP